MNQKFDTITFIFIYREKFSPALMEELCDKNWKIRKEALEKIAAILNEAKFITGNLGSLPEGIKVRLADNNKVLVSS
jgi:cytoskeleton-associated protein 5